MILPCQVKEDHVYLSDCLHVGEVFFVFLQLIRHRKVSFQNLLKVYTFLFSFTMELHCCIFYETNRSHINPILLQIKE